MGKSKCRSKKKGRKRRKCRVTRRKKGGRLYNDLVRDLSVIAPLYGDSLYDKIRQKDTPIDFTTEKGEQVKWNWLFTRHGPSCNNISSLLDKVQEPRLTDGGITRLLKHRSTVNTDYKSNAVFVSPLIRTWMTAIILYGTTVNNNSTPLTLYVAPFLKEHTKMGGVVKRGNYPVNIFEQLKSLFTFLDYLKNKLDSDKMVKFIDLMFPIYGKKKFEQASIHISTKMIKFQSKESIFCENLKENDIPEPLKDYYELEKGGEETMEWYNPYNYKSNGKIEKFIQWVITYRDMFKFLKNNEKDNKTTVHTVTHSNVMKSGVHYIRRSLCQYGKKYKKEYKNIFDTNAWSLYIPNSNVRNITKKEHFKKGISKKGDGDPSWEKSTMCTSLNIGESVMITDSKNEKVEAKIVERNKEGKYTVREVKEGGINHDDVNEDEIEIVNNTDFLKQFKGLL